MRKWMIDARQNKNLTQQQLADSIGITRQAISSIENGNSFPRPKIANAIAATLDEDVRRFYEPQEDDTTSGHVATG